MTYTKRAMVSGMGMLLMLALILSLTGATAKAAATGRLPGIPGEDEYITNAAVTVRTQRSAYRINDAIRGIDVSKYQGTINWSQVAQTDIRFAFIRASYGTTDDPYFISNAKRAHENGIKVGAYHFATFKTSAEVKKEAAFFINRLKQVEITYPVVLDLEGASHKKIKRATLTALAREFMDLVRAEGYTVMLYSYNNFIRDHLDVEKLGGYNLWVANYLEPPSFVHKVWQYSATGRVSGINGNVDLNVAYSDLSTTGTIRVNKDLSVSIKQTINDRYGAGLALDSTDITQLNTAIVTGLQYEAAYLWDDGELRTDGVVDELLLERLTTSYSRGLMDGYMTYLIQARLVYRGLYKNYPTGWIDEETVTAIKALQRSGQIEADGELNAATLQVLFAV